jgi:hypothetical protein
MNVRDTDGTDREKRWVVLAQTGQHSWLGRHSDPSDQELAEVSLHMTQAGLGAWLCVAEGVYWGSGPYSLLEVRRLAEGGEFEAARDEFLRRRQEELEQTGE